MDITPMQQLMSGNTTRPASLEERLSGAVLDSPNIVQRLSSIEQPPKGQPLEIVTELPAGLCPEIIIAMIMRWRELQIHFDRDIRVYAWSFNTEVEKYVLQCTNNMSHIFVSILPVKLRGDGKYV